jgi:hypothetical protein
MGFAALVHISIAAEQKTQFAIIVNTPGLSMDTVTLTVPAEKYLSGY